MSETTGPVTDPNRDVSQAVERTQLSWRRTVLSALAVVLLAATKVLMNAPRTVAALAVWLMVLGWFAITYVAWRRMTSLRASRLGPANRSAAVMALLVAALALLAAVLVR